MPDPFDNPEEFRPFLANVLLGDRLAERELWSHLDPTIRRAVNKLVPLASLDLKEDLIQGVRAHLSVRNFRVLQRWNAQGPLLGFVWVVARNRVLDQLEALPPPAESMEEFADPAGPDDPEQNVVRMQLAEGRAECIKRARERLSRGDQEIIHLRHDLNLKHREIAARLGRTLGYVGPTLARAERRLRNKLRETCRDHLGIFGEDE
jgi:RNA polymerase sigma factor (sigma-70 family)